MQNILKAGFLGFGLLLLLPFSTQAFNANLIITDEEMQNYNIWNENDVQSFLDAKASYLRNYKCEDAYGNQKLASEIIYDASIEYKVNPKYVLVTLQKEQSLITTKSPSAKQLDWAGGYGVCDSCSMSDPKIQKYKGFGKQVDNIAGVIRWYYDNTDHPVVKQKNESIKIDGKSVRPQSWATAFLYTYTPHLHGNENFYNIWKAWFGNNYPNGSILKASGSEEVWLIQNNQRRKFKNMAVLASRVNPNMIIAVPNAELSNYDVGSDINFPNYSLLKSGSKYYLVDYDNIRPFDSYSTVQKLGYHPDEVIEASSSDISSYTKGKTITLSTVAPQGVVYEITDIEGVYFLLKDNETTPLLNKSVVQANYNNLAIEKHPASVLKNFTQNRTPLGFKDGTLISGGDYTYVMEDNKKRRIGSDETFEALGYKKSNITNVPASLLFTMGNGDDVTASADLVLFSEEYQDPDEFVENLYAKAEVKDLYKSKLPAYIIAKYPSGEIISGKNLDTKRSIASLTKLTTAYEAVAQGMDMGKYTVYEAKKHSAYGNYLKLIEGEAIKNSDLLDIALVRSINNTAKMLATATGLDEASFISKINGRLADWGAVSSHIDEPTGLEEENISTARDLANIFFRVLGNDILKENLGKKQIAFKEAINRNASSIHRLNNSNKMITSPMSTKYKVLASKTGFTYEAQATLTLLIESVATNEKYVIITLGDSNYSGRFVEPNKMAEWVVSQKTELAGL